MPRSSHGTRGAAAGAGAARSQERRRAPPRIAKEPLSPRRNPANDRVMHSLPDGRGRRGVAVSYREEETSDEESSEEEVDDTPSSPPPGKRRRSGRVAGASSRPAKRRSSGPVVFDEDDSEDELARPMASSGAEQTEDELAPPKAKSKRQNLRPSSPARPSRASSRTKSRTTSTRLSSTRPSRNPRHFEDSGYSSPPLAKSKSKGRRCADATSTTLLAAGSPNSTTDRITVLPFLVLQQIFMNAAAPLDDPQQTSWLINASTVCKAFTEPSLRALYRCPPLLNMPMAHGLVRTLAMRVTQTKFPYGRWVRSLEVDVGQVAARAFHGQHLDLGSLVSHCPRLQHLNLFHKLDFPPYRQLESKMRWSYPIELFQALSDEQAVPAPLTDAAETVEESPGMPSLFSNPTESLDRETSETSASSANTVALPRQYLDGCPRLLSWSWNSRMLGSLTTGEIKTMAKTIHMSTGFASLRKATFVNFHRPSKKVKNATDEAIAAMDKAHAEDFASVIQVLPELEHLVFESCTIIDGHLAPLLPSNLKHLEFINCEDITTDAITEFISLSGRELRHLTLHHNQSLSLGFLPLLGPCCPNLQSLQMDLNCYSKSASYDDSDPNYDDLLLPDQVPRWPSTLRVVEVDNMRKWKPEAAAMFLQSFLDHAPGLPDLRVLSIKAMLDVPWRQRSAMREAWDLQLKRCFARRKMAPRPWRSIADVPLKRDVEAEARRREKMRKRTSVEGTDGPSRRSGRISAQASARSSRASSVAKALRKLERGRVSYREPDTDEDDAMSSSGEQDSQSGDKQAATMSASPEADEFIQGRCEVVDVRFDNQKPADMQFGMEDFLDASDGDGSDEDWDGHD